MDGNVSHGTCSQVTIYKILALERQTEKISTSQLLPKKK
jgi:hypothetical protein